MFLPLAGLSAQEHDPRLKDFKEEVLQKVQERAKLVQGIVD